MSNEKRNRKGNVLLIIVVTLCLLVVPLLIGLSQFGVFSVDRDRIQNVVEAAALVAANDISRIVIPDQHFGYVSLSNYPPTGTGTLAMDGEPLPVTGINTLIGTVRQCAIVARELGNETMASLVDDDHAALESTIDDINAMLASSLQSRPDSSSKSFVDVDGNQINPADDVASYIRTHLPSGWKLESMRLSNGWLEGGSTSATPAPKPESLAQLKSGDMIGGFYKGFVTLPACGKDFTFAGLGLSSSLVPDKLFREADNDHICSIVKVDCVVSRVECAQNNREYSGLSKIRSVACSQPYSMPDGGPKGVMTVRFMSSPVTGLQSWGDFLSPFNFHDRHLSTYEAEDGDYPIDRNARLVGGSSPETRTAQLFAESLYCWLRNGRTSPRIDAVLSLISERFQCSAGEIYLYEFAKEGTISRRIIKNDPFPAGVTSDAQSSSMADTSTASGKNPVIIFRNNVRNVGIEGSGKHAGQPLAGNPINWCEASEYSGNEFLALSLGKGSLSTGLTVTDATDNSVSGVEKACDSLPVSRADKSVRSWQGDRSGAAASSTSKEIRFNSVLHGLFKNNHGKLISNPPRKSYYSGGLALHIEIGGIGESTAEIDVARMRRLSR